jgi:Kyakuja-Dileera-Zisupton transposase
VNVDYSVCNALNFNSHGLHESIVVYDVYCQYGVHFEDRLEDVSEYLSLDPEMKIFGAIGKFHLADHVDSCYSKWTLNFMKGAGHIDGEIMETLWSGMNKVSGAARSMGKAHRQETLDDYMRDSNWKKTVGIGKSLLPKPVVDYLVLYDLLVATLITKLKRSQNGLISTQPAFEELTKSCVQRKLPVDSWKHDEILAMEERGESLNIFDLNHEKAPTLAQVTLQLCDNKDSSNGYDDVVDWIADGIKAESDQWVFKTIFRLLFF